MGWIKRNLFFSIGGTIALLLLGAAGFYTYISWQRNEAAFTKLDDIYKTLKDINNMKPLAGKNGENIQLAKDQEKQIRQWISTARNHFKPIAPIPDPAKGQMTSQAFGDTLSRTIAQLQNDAATANVGLPPGYTFSFRAEYGAVKFAPGSLQPLSEQVGAVAAISTILFSTHVNSLESIQRIRVSEDDAVGQQSDYISGSPFTNSLAVLTPYQVTFRAFTPELAEVLTAFAASPHGFIVQTVNVLPASEAATPANGTAQQSGAPQPAVVRTSTGEQVFLNEQLLRVTMEIEIVKLAPGT